MEEILSKENIEKCKNTIIYFLENNYITQPNTCISHQLAYNLAKKKGYKNTEHYSTYLTIDDTLITPEINEIAKKALTELAEQKKIFNSKSGKFYLHVEGTSLFDAKNTQYFLAVPVEKKK